MNQYQWLDPHFSFWLQNYTVTYWKGFPVDLANPLVNWLQSYFWITWTRFSKCASYLTFSSLWKYQEFEAALYCFFRDYSVSVLVRWLIWFTHPFKSFHSVHSTLGSYISSMFKSFFEFHFYVPCFMIISIGYLFNFT